MPEPFAPPSPRGVLRRPLTFEGHRYEVLLDRGGPWDGLVHVTDAELPHDAAGCTDVVFTGARWDPSRQLVTWNGAKEFRPVSPAMLDAVGEVLRAALAS